MTEYNEFKNFVDLASDRTFTDYEIDRRLQRIEWANFSSRQQQNLHRFAIGKLDSAYVPTEEEITQLEAYETFLLAMKELGAEIRADNALLKDCIAFEQAVTRLQQTELSKGEPETVQYTHEGWKFDEEGNKIPICREVHIPAIDSLPLTVPGTDEDGNPIEVPNPLILQDEQERATAQSVIDNTSPEVLALAEDRKQQIQPNPCEV